MKILVVDPNKAPRVEEIEDTLEAKQKVVHGLIEMTFPPNHPDDVCIICNEEGKFNGSLPNRPVRLEDGSVYDIIFDSFLLIRAPEDSEDFASVTDEQVEYYTRLYR